MDLPTALCPPEATMEDFDKFSEFLTKTRKEKKLRLKFIANGIGVALSTIVSWEKGQSFPDENRLPSMAEVYGVDEVMLRRLFDISRQAREKEKKVKLFVHRRL
jgi:transcriptional regulator with XRE-family HTH domain